MLTLIGQKQTGTHFQVSPPPPPISTVAQKRQRSFCRKCWWQATVKHAHKLDCDAESFSNTFLFLFITWNSELWHLIIFDHEALSVLFRALSYREAFHNFSALLWMSSLLFDRIKLLTCTPQNSQGLNGSLLQNLMSWVQVHGGEDQYVDTHHKTLMTNQICNMTCMCYCHAFQMLLRGGGGGGRGRDKRVVEGGGGGGASDT